MGHRVGMRGRGQQASFSSSKETSAVRGQSGPHRGTGSAYVCVVPRVCMSTCIRQTDVTGRQMLSFWKILEVCPQSGCSRGAGPI